MFKSLNITTIQDYVHWLRTSFLSLDILVYPTGSPLFSAPQFPISTGALLIERTSRDYLDSIAVDDFAFGIGPESSLMGF